MPVLRPLPRQPQECRKEIFVIDAVASPRAQAAGAVQIERFQHHRLHGDTRATATQRYHYYAAHLEISSVLTESVVRAVFQARATVS